MIRNINSLDVPQDGVPPREVLKKMFPKKKLDPSCLVPVSLSDFTSWLKKMSDDYEQRKTNVGDVANSTSNSDSGGGGGIAVPGGRKKRSTFVKPDEFCATLMPPNGVTYGINPKQQGNTLSAAIICQCDGAPWKRVRKQIKYKYCYSENLVDPEKSEFKTLKMEIEKSVCFTSFLISHIILNTKPA